MPGAAAAFAPWALLVGVVYRIACSLPALGFDEGTVWDGGDALFSAMFPVFWLADPRSNPAAWSNVALATACGAGLLGRPRLAWRAAVVGAALGAAALALLYYGGPVTFDEGGTNTGQFRRLLPGGVLWLATFGAAGGGAVAALAVAASWAGATALGRLVRLLAAAAPACALVAATLAWHARTVDTLPARVDAAARADDPRALETAFRLGGLPESEPRILDLITTLGRARAGRAAQVAVGWRLRLPHGTCETPPAERALAALDAAAVETGSPAFVQLAWPCRRSGTRAQHPATWSRVVSGALARERAAVLAELVASGLDARCPLTPDGPPLDSLLAQRLSAAALDTVYAAMHADWAANRAEVVDGCGFPPGTYRTPPPPPAPVPSVTPSPYPALLRPKPVAADSG